MAKFALIDSLAYRPCCGFISRSLAQFHRLDFSQRRYRTECTHPTASAYYLAIEAMGLTCILEGELKVFEQNHQLQSVLPNATLPSKRISAVVANSAQSAKNMAVLNLLKRVFREKQN